MKPLLLRAALRPTTLAVTQASSQLHLLRTLQQKEQHILLLNEYACLSRAYSRAALQPKERSVEDAERMQQDLVNDNPDSLLKNLKNFQDQNQKRDPSMKPTLEQLLIVKEKLVDHLPKFLKTTHPYALYTADVIFENNYSEPGKTTVGVFAYMLELIKLRFKINMKFSNAVIEILKITHDQRDGTVKIRWRLKGYRGFKSMFVLPWKVNPFNVGNSIKNEREWHDGFSIMYVNGLGYIYKHTLQRVMTQEDEDAYLKNKNKNLNLNVNI